MNFFVGTNFGHGSAVAALNENGVLFFATEEGSLVRMKNCDHFPIKSLQLLFETHQPQKVFWAEGWNRWKRFVHKGLETTLRYGFYDSSYFESRFLKETKRLFIGLYSQVRYRHLLNDQRFVGHHLAHAYSLLPWRLPPKSLIVISDTTAEYASVSIFYWCGSEMRLLLEIPYPHSLGSAFHQMAYHLGFHGRTGPGKLMALSAYGEPKWLDEFNSICNITNKGFRFNLLNYPAWRRKDTWRKFALNTSNHSLRKSISKNFGRREEGVDLARSIQDFFSFNSLNIIKHALELARSKYGLEVNHIGLAGGTALNCQTNRHIVKASTNLGVESITVSPWSDDPGTAVGAAAWIYHRITNCIPQPVQNAFLGMPVNHNYVSKNVSNVDIEKAAKVLAAGGIIALVSGRQEFGPRALGNRCLLGDPRNNAVKQRLNAIKKRPQFMPFAPVILENEYQMYFQEIGSTNMAWTVKSTERARQDMPAAIHANGEARVQILPENPTLLLSKLLISFRSLTGIGAVLLTSLNREGEPIADNYITAKQIVNSLEIEGILSDMGWEPIL